jgi:succinate-semialdehyde dehydrogenase / glutarate-semialdehyde dehydrogenase
LRHVGASVHIDGAWVDALNRGTIPVTNPATGETLCTVPRIGAEETRHAIEAADRALTAWRAKTAKERAQILRNLYDLMMANQEDLATSTGFWLRTASMTPSPSALRRPPGR